MNFELIIAFLLLIPGFLILTWGADILIVGAASLAKRLGISPLVIGLTIIALGTSLPEIVISFIAGLKNNPQLAIGNAIGSNIANISLVLGITSLLVPLKMRSMTLKKELPLLFLVMLLVGILMLDGMLTTMDSIILMLGALILVLWLIYQGIQKQRKKTLLETEYKQEIPKHISMVKAILKVVIGIVLLPIGSKIIVDNASHIALFFNISNLVIGLTIIALGTSLPELATSLVGAYKKEYDIIIGNVIGSNIFNLLAVLAIPAFFHPVRLHHYVLYRDFAFMFGISILLYIFSFSRRGAGKITRFEGAFLICTYVAYLGCLYFCR